MTEETQFVYLFAGLLAVSAVILLFVPFLRHVWLFSPSRLISALIALAIFSLALGAVALVLLAISNPLYSVPIVAVAAGLRLSSPTLLYRKMKDRFEAGRSWSALRTLMFLAYLGLGALLVYDLIILALVGEPPRPAVLSEQLLMALSASTLFVRFAFRARPKDRQGLLPVWLAAILFAVAFVVVAPYAFPEFAAAYLASGLVGWILGAIALRYDW